VTIGAAAATAFAPVAVADRNGWDESVHHGALVALDHRGRLAWAVGDPDVAVYPRSSLKPVQAAALLGLGLAVPDPHVALVCASHDGCPEHVAGVRELLAGAGCDERQLATTPGLPINQEAAADVVRTGGRPAPILHNCSGKHAGMMAVAARQGWPVEGYLDRCHPVQEAVLDHIDAVAGPVAHVGVDGCGAPAAVIALAGLARAVRALAVSGHRVFHAMTAHPTLVGGPHRDVTRLMRAVPGLMAKDGADGVYVAALADGRTVALKIADGANRARLPVMVAALQALGVDVPAADLEEPILGHGRPVGSVRALIGAPQ
jgi:L-asparaginase II